METKRTTTKDEKLSKQVDEIHDLKTRQLNGEIGESKGNKNDKFMIPDNEKEGYVHVYTEIKSPAADGKSIETEKNVIVIHKDQFDLKVQQGMFLTYDYVEIVHDPREKGTKYEKTSDFKPGKVSTSVTGDAPVAAPGNGANQIAVKKLKENEAKLNDEREQFEKDKAAFEADKKAHEDYLEKSKLNNEAEKTTENPANTDKK